MDSLDGKCGTCRWWKPRWEDADVGTVTREPGRCRRHAPTVELVVRLYEQASDESPRPTWPAVEAREWCGDYERKEQPSGLT